MMKIKLDENMPTELVAHLCGIGHDADTVESEGLKGCDDEAVWTACRKERRFLVTQDVAFVDIRRDLGSDHPGVLVIRAGEPGRQALLTRVQDVFAHERVEQWIGRVAVATPNKVRIRD